MGRVGSGALLTAGLLLLLLLLLAVACCWAPGGRRRARRGWRRDGLAAAPACAEDADCRAAGAAGAFCERGRCHCGPGGWAGARCEIPAGCNAADAAGRTGDAWCRGGNPGNGSTCDAETGQCVCEPPFVADGPAPGGRRAANGARPCTACQAGEHREYQDDGSYICMDVPVPVGGCTSRSSDYCYGQIPDNGSYCNLQTGTCHCAPGYINSPANDNTAPCTECAPGFARVGDSMCVPAAAPCLAAGCRDNGGQCSSSGQCICPAGSSYIGDNGVFGCGVQGVNAMDVACACSGSLAPGCYSPAPPAGDTPAGYALRETRDCYNVASPAWRKTDRAGRDYYTAACECEFGAGARHAGGCGANCGPGLGTLRCLVPWVVAAGSGAPPPPHEACTAAAAAAAAGGEDRRHWVVEDPSLDSDIPYSRCTDARNESPRGWNCPAV